MLALRRLLVGTTLGRVLERLREAVSVWKVVSNCPEQGGMVMSDICSRLLRDRLCAPGTVYLDVGSHIGSVIAAVQHHDPSIKVIAFEAVPDKAASLAAKFPAATIHQCAVGAESGTVPFFVDVNRPGYSSLSAHGNGVSGLKEISVELRRLDDLVPAAARVDFVKIDVEGHELGVVRGAAAMIARCRPVIMFESAPPDGNPADRRLCELFDCFAFQNYLIFPPERVAHNGPSLSSEGYIEAHYYPRRTTNYFAIPAERRIEIRDRARKVMNVRVARSDP